MRVLLLSAYYAPELTAIGKYNAEMATWLQAQGHEVRVVCMPPHYPAWKVWPGYSSWRYTHDHPGGVPVWRCPTWVPQQPGGLKRLISMGLFALTSVPVMLRQLAWRPDVIFVVEPPLFLMFPALLTGAIARCPVWLHVQDLEVDAAFDLQLLKGQRVRQWALGVERWLMSHCGRVSTISHRMMDRLRSKGVAENRLLLFPNWVELPEALNKTPSAHHHGYRQQLGLSEADKLVLYAGNMGAKQGLEVVVEAAQRLQGRADVHFLLVGEGPAQTGLKAMAEGLQRVHFLPLQPAERLHELLSSPDVHLLPQRAAAADLVMPSKLAGIMASGRPVVACTRADTEIASVVHERGLVVPPEDAEALAQGIVTLLNNPEQAAQWGAAARDHVEAHLERDAVLRRFERLLTEAITPE